MLTEIIQEGILVSQLIKDSARTIDIGTQEAMISGAAAIALGGIAYIGHKLNSRAVRRESLLYTTNDSSVPYNNL